MATGYPFITEYAKSSRSHCRGCNEKIVKNELRLAQMVQSEKFDGKIPNWFHFSCFWLQEYVPGNTGEIDNFDSLRWDDQEKIRKVIEHDEDVVWLPSTSTVTIQPKRKHPKNEKPTFKVAYSISHSTCCGCSEEIIRGEVQACRIDSSSDNGRRPDIVPLWHHLECFEQARQFIGFYDSGENLLGYKMLKREDQTKVAKALPKINGVNLQESDYEEPPKKIALTDAKEQNRIMHKYRDALKNFTHSQLYELLRYNKQVVLRRENSLDRVADAMAFGALKRCSKCGWGQLIFKSGIGYWCSMKDEWGTACGAIYDDPARKPFIVPENFKVKYGFLNEYKGQTVRRVFKRNPPAVQTNLRQYWQAAKSMNETKYKSTVSAVKLRVHNGVAVDPQSKYQATAHVYRDERDNVYNASLSLTDVEANINKYYKIQLLESNQGKCYWLFKSWGRIGTICGSFSEKLMDKKSAVAEFEAKFLEKTGNLWTNRKNFIKKPFGMVMVDVSYEDDHVDGNVIDMPSNLERPVHELVKLIFNVDLMKSTMKEMELDLEKMPLGKLSRSQIRDAFVVLATLEHHVRRYKDTVDPKIVVTYTNQFYSIIPHDFGINTPPLLNNMKVIKEKTVMLHSLMEIEIAYSLMQQSDGAIDSHYLKLRAEILPLRNTNPVFDVIRTYVENTHCETHNNFELQILEIFEVNRNGETERYAPFKNFPNRKLLWHGSRLTNFASILSQGIRIAPPEAPVSGYMFGKGIYFADMVSKSANYCMANFEKNVGLLLLCEVALGDMHELFMAQNLTKPPSGKSSVKGVGRTCPDPRTIKILHDGVIVPLGRGILAQPQHTSLLYNEYIVYNEAQVRIRYLVKVKFDFIYDVEQG